MKKLSIVLVAIVVMTISTAVYANAVVTINNAHSDVTYAANYFSETPPPVVWYNWTYLGITEVLKLNGSTILINVNLTKVPSELSPLQTTQPIFQWNEKFYQVSSHQETPELPSTLRGWEVPVGGAVGAGWTVTGAVVVQFLRKRREQK